MLQLADLLPVERYLIAARDEARRLCERWDVPRGKEVKEDLRDVRGRYQLTADGHRITGLLLDADMQHGSDSPAFPLLLALFPILAAFVVFGQPVFGFLAPTLGSIALLVVALLCIPTLGFLGTVGALMLGVLMPMSAGILLGGIGGMSAGWSLARFAALGPAALMPVIFGAGALLFLTKHPFGAVLMRAACFFLSISLLELLSLPLHLPPGLVSWLAACSLPLIFVAHRHVVRALALAHQGNTATIASSMPLATAHIAARAQQAEQAAKDCTAFIRYGTTKGVFVGKMDPFSPDEGLPFGQTINDLDVHVMVLGSTGTGKTSAVLKPLVVQCKRALASIGMVILDGKGTLAGEFDGMHDYTLIEPGRISLGLIEGLEPTDVVLALMNVNQPKSESGSSKFFTTGAGEMLRHFCVFLQALVNVEKKVEAERGPARSWRWCMQDIYALGIRAQRSNQQLQQKMDGYIDLVRRHAASEIGENVLGDSLQYLTTVLPGMDAETRANIWATLQGWITPLMSHPDLRAWANVETGVSFDDLFFGRQDFGVCTPEVKYGVGGSLVQSLVKQRLTTRIRRRAAYDWKSAGEIPVVFVVDEAQEIVGVEDRIILPIARSLGARMVYATQNIENFIVRLGGLHEANGFLDCFQSPICFKSSPATMQWMQARLGQTMTLVPSASAGHVAYEQNSRIAAEGPMSDPQHTGGWVYRMLARQGGGGTASATHRGGLSRHASSGELDFDKLALNTSSIRSAELKLQPLLLDSEYDAYTAEKFVAVAQVIRGGVRRRDVIMTHPIFELPEDIMDPEKDKEPAATVAQPEKPSIVLDKPDEGDGNSTAARERTSHAFREEAVSASTTAAGSMRDAAAEVENAGRFDASLARTPRPSASRKTS